MGRKRVPNKREFQVQQLEGKIAAAQKGEARAQGGKFSLATHPVVRYPWLWLLIAFLLPNLGALWCGFIAYADGGLILNNPAVDIHSLRQLSAVWTAGNEAMAHIVQHYRPVSQTIYALTWLVGGGNAVFFHAVGLAAGLTVVLLLYKLLLAVQTPPRVALVAALLFALFPIHTSATTSIEGSTEPMAAAFGLGALLFYYRRRPILALLLFTLAVFSKESASAFAALPLIWPRKDWRSRDSLFTVAGAGIVIAVALFANHAVNTLSPGEIVPWNNPTVTVSVGQRMLTALWVQVLYVCKTIAPITLSTDYSFNEITNVMGFADWRSWAGLALIAGAVPLSVRYHQFRAPILAYAILFSPTANLLFPLTDIMQEHLAYAPSMGLALLAAILVARCRHWKIIILAAALIFGARTLVRNRDWLNDEHFCAKAAETSPNSANANFLNGYSRWATRDYAGAIVAFDRTIAINPTYTKAYFGRGIAFAALGRGAEAVADFRVVQRLDGYKHALPDDVRTYVERYSQLRGISAN